MPAETLRCFAVASPGTEALVAAELRALPGAAQVRDVTEQPGGVEWSGDLATLYRANLHLRVASRILLRLGTVRATRFDELRRALAALPWRRFAPLDRTVPLLVTASAQRCRLIHTGALAERAALAIGDAGLEVSPIRAEQAEALLPETVVLRVLLRGEADRFEVSVDTSGALLHLRGYRQDVTPAPLRETLAAALLLQAGFRGDEPLCDPMCGSGTLLLEAALLAKRRAPGLASGRAFALQHWPGFDPGLWRRLVDEARALERPLPRGLIFGADRDPQAVQAALANARRAGLQDQVPIEVADVLRSRLPEGPPGLVLCNPPYGRRLGGPELSRLYRGLGRFARSRPGWRLALLTTNPELAAQAGPLAARHRLRNGGLLVHLCEIPPAPAAPFRPSAAADPP